MNAIITNDLKLDFYLSGLNDTYRHCLKSFLESLPDFKWESVKDGFNKYKESYSYSYLRLLKTALKELIKSKSINLLEHSQIDRKFKQLKVPSPDKTIHIEKCLTEIECKNLYDSAKSKRMKSFTGFLLKTGVRVSEAISIRLTNIEIQDGNVFIKLIGKGSKERRVFINEKLFNDIRLAYPGNTYLFENKKGNKISRQYMHRVIKNLGKKINRDIHPHTCRHSFATIMYKKDKDINKLSKYLGHANIAVTSVYVHDEYSPNDVNNNLMGIF